MKKDLQKLLKLDKKDRKRLEDEEKALKRDETAMIIYVICSLIASLVIVAIIVIALAEVAAWTK